MNTEKSCSRRTWLACSSAVAILLSAGPHLFAADEETVKKYEEITRRGLDYLRTSQADDGSYSSFAGIGPTVLATTAMLRLGRTAEDPTVAKALGWLEKQVREDGGIYADKSRVKNYETCVAVLCFQEANEKGKYDDVLKNARDYLKGLQWTEDHDVESGDFRYGGGGYEKDRRPDLSNTAFLVDALQKSNNPEDREAIQRALIFVSRCQNLESEHNTTPNAAKVNDGGFYYSVTAGEQAGGNTEEGGLRSYGSMTYGGLKSMIYAGLEKDDKRVAAAVKWIENHYTLSENPNMGDNGLYYYYHTFAKALDALDQEQITDKNGKKHDWRKELIGEMALRQQTNGSWVNKNTRWLEGDPNLVTSFALLALSHANPQDE